MSCLSRDPYPSFKCNLNFDVRILVQGHCVVIVTLFYFKVDIEQDAMRKPLVIKQETE